jgi:hypothetical protein
MLALVFTTSCSDYLNINEYFDDELKLDTVFARKRYIEAYLWGTAQMFPDASNLFRGTAYTPGPYATDEAFTLAGAGEYYGIDYVLGGITPTNVRFLTWIDMYRIIRRCNTVLQRIDEAPDWTVMERYLILSYIRFFRAYAYYNIIIDYGPPILLGDEVLKNNEPIEYYDAERALYDEAVEYVCTELEEAARALPAKQPILDFGRPTKGAAYGLIARLRLIQASPLYNGGSAARLYYGTWKRKSDGKNYISQTYDERKWAVAAAAARRVMEMSDGVKPLYELYTVLKEATTPELPANVTWDRDYYKDYPEGANGIDHYRSVSEIFNGESVAAINPEYVWGRISDMSTEMIQRSFPISAGGWSENCVPQKVIDNFRMIDGRGIYDSSDEYPYRETGFSEQSRTFSGYFLNAGVFNMYINREMRFYANIGFSECYWPMSSTSTSGKHDLTIRYYYDSADGKSGAHNDGIYTATGYVIKKFIHPMDAFSGDNSRRMQKSFGIIRYAEILLSYVEALNNLTTSHDVALGDETYTVSRDPEAMRKAFNNVRYRAGLPGVTDYELADAKTMQSLIEQERMIEFLHENRRYYDVRRWGKYEETESEPIMGMNVDAPKDGFYNRVVVNSVRVSGRKVDKKMVLLPISKDEVRRMPKFDQNPGWED